MQNKCHKNVYIAGTVQEQVGQKSLEFGSRCKNTVYGSQININILFKP